MPGAATPEAQAERDQFAAANPAAAAAPASAESAPQDQTPKADGQVAQLTGQKTEQAGPASAAPAPAAAGPAAAGGAAPAAAGGATPAAAGGDSAAAAPAAAGGDAPAGGGSAPAAPQRYTFSVGGTTVTIADDGSAASLEVPPTKLWSSFGAGPAEQKASWSIPVPVLPIVQFNASVSMNYLFRIGDGNLTGATVSKNGTKYTISAGLQTGLSCGFGVGVAAGVSAGVWLVSAGAGISGTAQVGGNAPITSNFSVVYDSATGQLSGAADIATGRMMLPITANISAFVYGEVLGGIFGQWKKSWPLMNANLGSLVIGASKAGFTYASGQAAFTGQPPIFGYDSTGANLSFMGQRS